jgi:hypothetical protein
MTTNDFAGAVLVLDDPSRADEIAEAYVNRYFPDSDFHYIVTDAPPTSLPTHIQDQLSAHQRDLGSPSQVLTVYPWALVENTLPERATNGQFPR